MAAPPHDPLNGARVAIVHDWLVTPGGAELVLAEMLSIFPRADLFTLIDERREAYGVSFGGARQAGGVTRGGRRATTSILQHVPGIFRHYRSFLPLMPLAVRGLDVSAYDVVISNSHAIAKGVPTHDRQLHLCYCLSPMRYAWDLREQYLREAGLDRGVRGVLARAMLERMRRWDLANTSGVDAFATLSRYIAERIQRAYGRAAEVIYPPVDTEFFTPLVSRRATRGAGGGPQAPAGFYVTASRFVPYKRLDLIARAFARLPDRHLVIIGDGPDAAKVRGAAGPNVTLLGRLSRASVRDHLRQARAFVFAAEEDFGIAPVEAQACGTPVIAYGKGGVAETVTWGPGGTGVVFEEQTEEAIADAVRRFEALGAPIPAERCRERSLRFSADRFRRAFHEFVARGIRSFPRA